MSTIHAANCPSCGVVTTVPHNTQERCIEALQDEILRIRQILEQVGPQGSERRAADARGDEPETSQA